MNGITLPVRFWRIVDTDDGPMGHTYQNLDLEAHRTALLIVDVYGKGYDDEPAPEELKGIYTPDPRFRHIIRDLIPPVKAAARLAGITTIYLTNALRAGMSEGNVWRNLSHRATGVDVLVDWQSPTPVLEFASAIAPDDDDVVIEKQLYSGFYETGLDSALRNRGIETLILVGFDSRVCLGSTATDAMFRNYHVVVLRDCVRTFEFPETAEGEWANFIAIRYLESQVGFSSTSEEFMNACEHD